MPIILCETEGFESKGGVFENKWWPFKSRDEVLHSVQMDVIGEFSLIWTPVLWGWEMWNCCILNSNFCQVYFTVLQIRGSVVAIFCM